MARYNWDPLFAAIGDVVQRQNQRTQYQNALDGLLGPSTGFAGQDVRMGQGGGLLGVTPDQVQQLRGMNPQMGYSMLGNIVQQNAQNQQFAREDQRFQQQQQALTRRPATPAEKAQYGLDPNTPAEIDGRGNLTPITDPRAITPYQQASLDNDKAGRNLQWAQFGETRRHNQAQEASGREGGGGLFSMIDTGQGVYGVTRNGTIKPMTSPDGKPLVSYHSDPSLRYSLNAAGAGGKGAGVAAEAWPQTQATFQTVGDTIRGFYDPAVRDQASKAIGVGAIAPTLPGVNSDFRSRQAQLRGQTFLNAFQALRGGGAITEIEGQKAESALLRANNALTPTEFYKALDEFSGIMGRMHHAARTRAERGAVVPQLGDPGASQNPVPAPAASGQWSNFRVSQ